MTPVIDESIGQTAATLENEICKISKLIDDPGRVGPGSYNPQVLDSNRSSPKASLRWVASKT